MKKTLITLLALSGLAMGETVVTTIDPLDLTWTFGAGTTIIDDTDKDHPGEMRFKGGGSTWAVYGSSASLTSAINLQKHETLTFSYALDMSGINSVTTFSLVGTSGALTIGHSYKYSDTVNNKTAIRLGQTSTTTNDKYVLSGGDRNGVTYITNYEELPYDVTAATDYVLTLKVSYDDSVDKFIGTLSSNHGDTTAKVELGQTFNVSKIVATFDGNTTSYISDASITVSVPEPTTATLSLLALAGLAARRRRK